MQCIADILREAKDNHLENQTQKFYRRRRFRITFTKPMEQFVDTDNIFQETHRIRRRTQRELVTIASVAFTGLSSFPRPSQQLVCLPVTMARNGTLDV